MPTSAIDRIVQRLQRPSARGWRGYAVAVGLVGLLTLLKLPLEDRLESFAAFSFFFPAIIISAWYGGLGPGLTATALGCLSAVHTILYINAEIHEPHHLLGRAGVFVAAGVLTSVLCEALHRVKQQVENRERQLRALTDALPVLIAHIDDDQHYRFCNQAYEQWFGVTTDAAVGKAVWEVIGNDSYCRVRKNLEAALSGKMMHEEVQITLPGGELRTTEATYIPERDSEGGVKGLFVLAHDITERRRAEEERDRLLTLEKRARAEAETAREQLLREDRLKNEFLAMLGHELRNPLGAIMNAAHFTRIADRDSPVYKRASDVLERQVTHMARLVDDLLDISRITRGKIELRCQVVDARTVVRQAVESAQALIAARHHALEVELPDRETPVHGDPARLEQVLSNLLVNAAKYTDPGGQIRLVLVEQDGLIIIEVHDTGIGIPADVLPRIFDLFIQADRALDRAQGGLGIGLTLVHRLVEMHGGNVRAFSDGPGHGSRFVVQLPRHETPLEEQSSMVAVSALTLSPPDGAATEPFALDGQNRSAPPRSPK